MPKRGPTKETVQKKTTKEKYLDSVYLSKEEYQKLSGQYGPKRTEAFILRLNNHKMAKGAMYKSDYHAILNWVVDAVVGATRRKGADEQDPSYPVDLVVSE